MLNQDPGVNGILLQHPVPELTWRHYLKCLIALL